MIYIRKIFKIIRFAILGVFVIVLFFEPLRNIYIKLFKINTFIGQYNLNDQLHGEIIEYEKGKISAKWNMSEGKIDGWYIEYYHNGKIKSKTYYIQNKAHGKAYSFYESGKLKIVSNYQNGFLYGNSTYYYENGEIEFYQAYNIRGDMFYQLSNKRKSPLN